METTHNQDSTSRRFVKVLTSQLVDVGSQVAMSFTLSQAGVPYSQPNANPIHLSAFVLGQGPKAEAFPLTEWIWRAAFSLRSSPSLVCE